MRRHLIAFTIAVNLGGFSAAADDLRIAGIRSAWQKCVVEPVKSLLGPPKTHPVERRPDGTPHSPQLAERDHALLESFVEVQKHGTTVRFRNTNGQVMQGTVDHIEHQGNGAGNETIVIRTANGTQIRASLWSIVGGTLEAHLATRLSPAEIQTYRMLKNAHDTGAPLALSQGARARVSVKSFGINVAGAPLVQVQLPDGSLQKLTILQASTELSAPSAPNSNTAQVAIPPTRSASPLSEANPNAGVDFMHVLVDGKPRIAAFLGFSVDAQGLHSVSLLYPGEHVPRTVPSAQVTVRMAAHVDERARKNAGGGDELDLDANHGENDFEPGTASEYHPLPSMKHNVFIPGLPSPSPLHPPAPSSPAAAAVRAPEIEAAQLNPDGTDPDESRRRHRPYRNSESTRVETILRTSLREGRRVRFQLSGQEILGVVIKFRQTDEMFILQMPGGGTYEVDARRIQAGHIEYVDGR